MTPEAPMTFETRMIGGLCRIYTILLYGYPREFRLQFGPSMLQLFRDRCRDMLRTPGRFQLLRFATQLAGDWLTTTVRERGAAAWSAVRKETPRNFVTEWAVTIVLFLCATTTMLQAYVVPTGSMESTIRVGDHMLVDRVAFSDPGRLGRAILPYRDVTRGDVVCFLYPEDVREVYVKRVIGLPGDRIHLDHKTVIRNGRMLVEPYTQHIGTFPVPYRDDFPLTPEWDTTPRGRDMLEHHVSNGEITVPPDTLFVLGDNRDNSLDSRYWGFVPRSYIVGKPLFVYWSYDAPTEDLTEWSVSHVVDVMLHFFSRTRWDRTLSVPRSQPAREAGGAQ